MNRAIMIALALLIGACAANIAPPDGAPDIGDTGSMCGGIAAFECKAPGDYCRSAPGECVNVADYAGICTPKPQVCTKDYRPVCGCDGKTYGNGCAAAAVGVSIAADGECKD